MSFKKSGLPNIFKKNYLAEKRDMKIVDEYINTEGRAFQGRVITKDSDLVKWRAKDREDAVINQNNIFEFKRIVKRYIFDMEKEQHGFTNYYISLLSDLLSKQHCKNYFQKRKEILKTNFDKEINYRNERLFVPDKTVRNKKIKSTLYLTHLDGELSDINDEKSEEIEKNFKNKFKGKTFNLSTNLTSYQQTQNTHHFNEKNEEEESFILKDPDEMDIKNPFTKKEHVTQLMKQYNFYKTDLNFFNLKKEKKVFPEDYNKKVMYPYREEFFRVLKIREDALKRKRNEMFGKTERTFNRFKKVMNTIE